MDLSHLAMSVEMTDLAASDENALDGGDGAVELAVRSVDEEKDDAKSESESEEQIVYDEQTEALDGEEGDIDIDVVYEVAEEAKAEEENVQRDDLVPRRSVAVQ